MYNSSDLEHHLHEPLTDTRELIASQQLAHYHGKLEIGHLPGWLLAVLMLAVIGMLILVL